MSIISVQELLALLLVAGKAVVASKAVSAELLLVAGKKDSAELLLVSGKVSVEVDGKEASGLINFCKELDSSSMLLILRADSPSPQYYRWLLKKTKTVRKQRCR